MTIKNRGGWLLLSAICMVSCADSGGGDDEIGSDGTAETDSSTETGTSTETCS